MCLTQRWLARLSLFAAVFAWLVIGLGAFTRLTDAGLGCPDWPGCYGHLVVPGAVTSFTKIKAWTEMLHRYFAGTLALLVIITAIVCVLNALRQGVSYLVLAIGLFLLVVYQALLGMWTVTLKLWPIVVSQHLLGGLTLLVLLWLIHLKSANKLRLDSPPAYSTSTKLLVLLSLVLVCWQVALGAWTSTNYAALSCQGFPFCGAAGGWQIDFHQAFNGFVPMGVNYEGGVLSVAARETIQMVHRLGALIVTVSLLVVAVLLLAKHRSPLIARCVAVMLLLLILQLGLGVGNVLFALPLIVAVLHNLVAALLLCSVVAINFLIFQRQAAYGK